MQFVRSFFFLKTIYFRQTPTRILIFYGYVYLVFGAFFLGFSSVNISKLWLLPTVVINYFMIRSILRYLIVDQRLKLSRPYAIHRQSTAIHNASVNFELDTLDATREISATDNTRIYDAIFDFYRQTKNGDYLARETYYTIFEGTLNRELPHLLFDSRTAKKRQFKYQYIKQQRISVQGHFDDYFDTYTPQTYHIDTLSFITPEVMEAMIAARDYDIEIIENKIILYAPLTDMKDIPALQMHGEILIQHLNDNIDNYRDNRISGGKRTTEVAPFGKALLKSSRKYVISAILSGTALAALLIAGLIDIHFFDIEFVFIAAVILGTNVYKAYDLQQQNNKALQRMYYLHNTDRGKPRQR